MNNGEMKLYGIPMGPFVRKVAVTLRLKNLAFEGHAIMPGDQSNEDFMAISPLAKVPALSDGDLGLADSSVICEYLEDQYPDISAYPSSPALKARARWLEEYADSKALAVCGPGIFFERVIKPKFRNIPCDEAFVQETIDKEMPPVLNYLEGQVNELIGNRASATPARSFLFGELGVADIALGSQFKNAHYAGFEVDAERWPQFADYLDRVWASPAFSEELKEHLPLMEDLLMGAEVAA
jgi:glutathione S-transferase